MNKNRKAASRWLSIDGGAVIRGAYYAYVTESYKYPSTSERELSNPGALELEQPEDDRRTRRARAKLRDRELGVWIFCPRRRGL